MFSQVPGSYYDDLKAARFMVINKGAATLTEIAEVWAAKANKQVKTLQKYLTVAGGIQDEIIWEKLALINKLPTTRAAVGQKMLESKVRGIYITR